MTLGFRRDENGDMFCRGCDEFIGRGTPSHLLHHAEECVVALRNRVASLENRLADMEAKVNRAANSVRTAFANARRDG